MRLAPLLALALTLPSSACGDPSSTDGPADPTTSTAGTPGSTSGTDAASSTGTPTDATATAADSTTADSTAAASTTDPDPSDTSTGTVDFDPYFFDDFETHADGASLSNFAPFDAAGRTIASSAQAHRGSQSAQMSIRAGDGGGFGQWGAVLPIDPAVAKGGEIWVRLYVYWPSEFEFSASPWMKFLRLHNRAGDGENAGYNDLYVDRADETMSVLRTIKEVHDIWEAYDGPSLPRDTWERYEMYLSVDDVPVDDGGAARVRIWRDDALIFDRTDVPTITEAGGVIDYFYLFTYWNNEAPPDNDCWIDDLVIATDASPPPWTDAAGNHWIGDW